MYLKSLVLEFLLVIITTILHETTSFNFFCSDTTVFVNNSAYQTNLNTLFHSLSSNATNNPSGFYQTIAGNLKKEPIYGHYLCRGDQNRTSCYDCVKNATTTDLPNACPNKKNGIIYYDECMVRYSNESFFNRKDQSPYVVYWNTNPIIGNVTRYMEILGNLISNVIAVRAAEGGPVKKFATEFVNVSAIQPIYSLGQCTPDLTPTDCYACLNSSLETFNFRQAPGGQILTPSCAVRYEFYPFFNLSYLPPSSPPSQ